MTKSTNMKIEFLGGASEIGASCMLLETGETAIIVDCGTRIKGDNPIPDLDSLTGKSIDAVLVSHAHTDHTGALPILHEAFPGVPIYMTPPTLELVTILQRDALRLMESALEREGELPFYTEKQVNSMLSMCIPIQHGDAVTVKDVVVGYHPASHILGASMIHVTTPAGEALFTGDYSVSSQRTVPGLIRPKVSADIIISEATYGNRLHSNRKTAEEKLIRKVNEVVTEEGIVLIPAFAIGRAQEVLLILQWAMQNKRMPQLPVYADGMVRAVNQVYSTHEKYASRSLRYKIRKSSNAFYTDYIHPVKSPDERKEILKKAPCIIVSSSGMLSGGPSAFYASELVKNEKNAILITGYQDEESPGRALLALAENKEKELKLGEETYEVKCKFDSYRLSAHADRMQMAGFTESFNPRTVVLIHGDAEAKKIMADSLTTKDIVIAEDGTVIERKYPLRRKKKPQEKGKETARLKITPEKAAALLGPATGEPVSLEILSQAWFGEKVEEKKRLELGHALVATGLAKFHEEKQDHLWPLTKRSPLAEPTPEEIALEEDLKKENPKGTLLEFCARRNMPAPEKLATLHKGRHVVELKVRLDDEILSSGVKDAHSERMAEQLAARELLSVIAERHAEEKVVSLSDEEIQRLKLENPKGKLLEFVMKHKLKQAVVEPVAVPVGFRCFAAWVSPDEKTFKTKVYQAKKAKEAEQACCEEMLEQITNWMKETESEQTSETAEKQESSAGKEQQASVKEARVLLNEMKQKKQVSDFGYELIERTGESHQPVFKMIAWAILNDGAKVQTKPAEAGSKKEGQKTVADDLLNMLSERERQSSK